MLNSKSDKKFPAILLRQVGEHPPGTVGLVIRISSKRIACTYGFRPATVSDEDTSEFVPARRKDFRELKHVRGNDGKPKKARTYQRTC